MSREDIVVLASRVLAVLMMILALTEASYLPERVYAFSHYAQTLLASPSATEYYRHLNLIYLGFLIARIIGLSLIARWLFRGGPEVSEWLLPTMARVAADPTIHPNVRSEE
jgi:hypothetical protein